MFAGVSPDGDTFPHKSCKSTRKHASSPLKESASSPLKHTTPQKRKRIPVSPVGDMYPRRSPRTHAGSPTNVSSPLKHTTPQKRKITYVGPGGDMSPHKSPCKQTSAPLKEKASSPLKHTTPQKRKRTPVSPGGDMSPRRSPRTHAGSPKNVSSPLKHTTPQKRKITYVGPGGDMSPHKSPRKQLISPLKEKASSPLKHTTPQKRKRTPDKLKFPPLARRTSPRKHAKSEISVRQPSKRERKSAYGAPKEKKKCSTCQKSHCGPCLFCGEIKNMRYFHVKNTKKDSILYKNIFAKLPSVCDVDSMCDTCRSKNSKPLIDVQTKKPKNMFPCFLSHHELCLDTGEIVTSSESRDSVVSAFLLNSANLVDVPEQIHLCRKHYNVFNTYKVSKNCHLCLHIIARGGKRYLCKDPVSKPEVERASVINKNVVLTPNQLLCQSCYKYVYCKSSTLSLNGLSIKFDKLAEQCDDDSIHEKSVLFVCKYLCDIFKAGGAALFVDIYEKYAAYFNTNVNDLNKTCLKREKLLSELLDHFGNVLEVHSTSSTKQSKLLLFKHCDLKSLLHRFVYKLHIHEKKLLHSDQNLADDDDEIVSVNEEKGNAYCAALDLNRRLEIQAKTLTDHFVRNPLDLSCLEVESLLTFIDARIWNVYFLLTANTREKKELSQDFDMDSHIKLPMEVEDDLGTENRLRFNRRILAIFNLQFILNDNYNYPMQIIIANVVKRLSNSSKLLSVLNRTGFCVSEDTLDRYLENVAVDKERNCTRMLTDNAFTVVSIDNIDCQSPYAVMSTSSERERSWHGTSVMAQQPQPSKDFLFPLEKISASQRLTLLKVYGDGRCFYRCIAVSGTRLLLKALRNAYGIPSEGNLFSLETMLASKIQSGILSILNDNVATLNNLPADMKQLCLEKQSGVYYNDFAECLTDHRKPGTYASALQIVTTAFALKTQIHIYQIVDGTDYSLVATYPPDYYPDSDPIQVLYTPDTTGSPGHFDLLVDVDVDVPLEFDEMLSLESNISSFLIPWQNYNADFNPESDLELGLHQIIKKSFGTNADFERGVGSDKGKQSRKGKKRLSRKNRKKVRTRSGRVPLFKTFLPMQIKLALFEVSSAEQIATASLKNRLFVYVLERYSIIHNNLPINLPSLKCKFAAEDQANNPQCDKSKFAFIEVYNDKADCTTTIKKVLNDLHHTFKVSKHVNHLFIVGDLKTYEFIMKVKSEQGKAMDWVIPYVGDWHILKIYRL